MISIEKDGWSNTMVCGPCIDACHLVPQSAFTNYPLDDDDDDDVLESNSFAKLQRKYELTWSLDNALCLKSDLHRLHDARLLAIHPKTLRIRTWAPSGISLPYHGTTATFPVSFPSSKALEYHWKMCVIENMCA